MGASRYLAPLLAVCLVIVLVMPGALAWKNSSYTTDINVPSIGTHDWLANRSMCLLPLNETGYIRDNLQWFYYGTELPDNAHPLLDDGYGDTTKHHAYFDAQGVCTDSVGPSRAAAMWSLADTSLKEKDYRNASKYAGAMTHYIADLAVFGHVMGASTTWGTEVHHEDYESYVQNHHDLFTPYIVFDGSLVWADAAIEGITLARDTTLDSSGGGHGCAWMDANYNWSNQAFKDRAGQSMNKAANAIADLLHTLAVDTGYSTGTPPINNTHDSGDSPFDWGKIPALSTLATVGTILAVAMAFGICKQAGRKRR